MAWDFLLDVKLCLRPATCWFVVRGKALLEHSGIFDPAHSAVDEASLIFEFETELFGVCGRLMDMMKSFMFRYNAGCKICNVLGKLAKNATK